MANLFMRFPGGKPKCLTLSYDDGVINDRRLVALMTKYGLKGTFNLNSGEYADIEHDDYQKTHRRLPKQAAIELYRKSGFEVASHAVTHPFLEQLPAALCTQEILRDRRNLEADYGQIVRGFAYPYGTFNDSVVESLKAFNLIPEKKEVKVLLNGIYIVEAKSARGGLEAPPVKKTLKQKLQAKYQQLRKEEKAEEAKKSKADKKK